MGTIAASQVIGSGSADSFCEAHQNGVRARRKKQASVLADLDFTASEPV